MYENSMVKIIKSVKTPDVLRASSPAKVSNIPNCSFNLPAGPKFTCCGSTHACKSCYAQKGRHVFANVQSVMAKNYKLLNSIKCNVNSMYKLLVNVVPKNAKVFRIHSSGDFNRRGYINAWARVVRTRPDVRFWAYTRSFKLDFSPLTKCFNFTLWASTDDYNVVAAKQFVRRYRKSGVKHAYGPWEKDGVPKNSFLCPAVTKKIEEAGACEKCLLCVIKKRTNKNVVFPKH